MAYKCTKSEWSNQFGGYTCEFVCDSEADIASLPECNPLSTAIVATEGMPVYMVNASGEWVKV